MPRVLPGFWNPDDDDGDDEWEDDEGEDDEGEDDPPCWLEPEPVDGCVEGVVPVDVLVDVPVGVVELGEVVTVALGVVVVVVAEGWQFAVTLVAPGGTPGICAGGVPGAALTVIVTGVPPTGGVYVTVHWSADAIGIAAMPSTPRTTPTVITAIFSWWLLDTLVYLLPPRTWAAPIAQGGRAGTLTVGSVLCKGEPSVESADLGMS